MEALQPLFALLVALNAVVDELSQCKPRFVIKVAQNRQNRHFRPDANYRYALQAIPFLDRLATVVSCLVGGFRTKCALGDGPHNLHMDGITKRAKGMLSS